MLDLLAKINYLFMSFGIAVILISLVGAPVYAQLFGCDSKAIECAKKQGAIDAISNMVEGGIQGSTVGGTEGDSTVQQFINGLTQLLLKAQQDYDANC